jgi:nitrogen regulatory protein P-II 1
MKLITAIIQPHRLDSVKKALTDVEVFRLTVSDVQGYGQQKGQTEYFRGHAMEVNLIRKVKLMIAVNDNFVEPTIQAIVTGARSEGGKVGDGKIFVQPLDEVIRIRTGERGGTAI